MDNYIAKTQLRKLRKKANLTQQEMATMLGIKRTTYRNIETGPTRIINETIIKAAEILKHPVESILGGYGPDETGRAVLCERNEEYEKEILTLQAELDAAKVKLEESLDEITRLKSENIRMEEALDQEKQSYNDLKEINELQREILEKERKLRTRHD